MNNKFIVYLYYCLNSTQIKISPHLMYYLRNDEIDRAKKFVFERDWITYISSHAYLNQLLCKRLNVSPNDLPFEKNEFGKPSLRNAGFHFNLSHSRNCWGIAICQSAIVGIDIEEIRTNSSFKDIINLVCTEEEKDKLSNTRKPEEEFYKIWTRKEALLKTAGLGLNYYLKGINVCSNKITLSLDQHNNIDIFLKSLKISDKYITVASTVPFKLEKKEITEYNINIEHLQIQN